MVIYSHKDIKVTVNENEIYCTDADFSMMASIEPSFSIRRKDSISYVPDEYVGGTVGLNYYLTGVDPLADFSSPETPYSLEIGGICIKSGYLTNYSVRSDSNSLLSSRVQFTFFEEVKGKIVPDRSTLPDGVNVLNTNDMSIEGSTVFDTEGTVKNMDYSYDVQIEPSRRLGSSDIPYVTVSAPKVELSLEIYDYNIDLPISGIKDNFKINLNDKNHITQQSFSMDGYVMDKAIGATVKGTPIMKIKMGQASVGTLDKHKPYIIDIVPKSGGTGDTVRLLGNNFINVDKVLLGEFPCEIDSYDNTYLDFTVSRDIFSGYKAPVYLISDGAEAISPTGYLVTSGMLIF